MCHRRGGAAPERGATTGGAAAIERDCGASRGHGAGLACRDGVDRAAFLGRNATLLAAAAAAADDDDDDDDGAAPLRSCPPDPPEAPQAQAGAGVADSGAHGAASAGACGCGGRCPGG